MPKRLPKLTAALYRDILRRQWKTDDAIEAARQREFDAFLARMSAPSDPPVDEPRPA
jgi:hypothetical protein